MHLPPDCAWTCLGTRWGDLTLAASPRGLVGVWFVDQRHYPQRLTGPRDDRHPTLLLAQQQLQAYLAGSREAFNLPLDLSGGTAFQQSVWQALLQIPSGATCSYGDIGMRLGKPTAARAVGAAVGRNPISIIVPCHRVLGAQGALTGYAGGLERKARLLALETKHP